MVAKNSNAAIYSLFGAYMATSALSTVVWYLNKEPVPEECPSIIRSQFQATAGKKDNIKVLPDSPKDKTYLMLDTGIVCKISLE